MHPCDSCKNFLKPNLCKAGQVGAVNVKIKKICEDYEAKDDACRSLKSIISALKDKWFITYNENGKIQYHGQILERVTDDVYLVQFHDGLFGFPSNQEVINIKDMKGWKLYTELEDLQEQFKK